MKRIIALMVAILLFTVFPTQVKCNNIQVTSEYDLEWNRTYNEVNCYGNDVETVNNNVYVCGKIDDGTYWQAPILLRYDVNGTLLESNKTWGGSRIKAVNSSLYLLNIPPCLTHGPKVLAKLTENLSEIWSTPFPDIGVNYSVRDFSIDEQSGIYIVGSTFKSTSDWNGDALIMKFTLNGTYEWNRTFVGPYNDYFRSVVARNGIIYAGGARNTTLAPEKDIILLRYDISGNQIWKKEWGGSGTDICSRLALSNDYKHIFLSGITESYGTKSILLMKYNSTGNLSWYTYWGNDLGEGDLCIDNDDNIYIGTQYNTFFSYPTIIKFNASGNFLWNRSYWKQTDPLSIGGINKNGEDIFLVGGIGSNPNTGIYILKFNKIIVQEFALGIILYLFAIILSIIILKCKCRDS